MSGNPERRREGRISSDRETIRGWADEHNYVPVRAQSGGSDEYRFVREDEVSGSQERVDWDTFFADMEKGDNVVMFHGESVDEPFEVTRREDAVSRMDLEDEDIENRLIEGETITSKITETTVVEQVIVENVTVESQLVDTEMVDQRVVDVELISRECSGCELVEDRQVEAMEQFDSDRYFETIGAAEYATGEPMGALGAEGELPYHAELDVEEAWTVTREIDERLTVESRVVDDDVTETDTVQDRDIDVEGLHRTIAESDILGDERSPDEVMTEYEIETEFDEGEAVRTYFDRQRVVEDEVVDRRSLRADIVEGELLGMETVHTQDIADSVSDEEVGATETEVVADTEVEATADEEMAEAEIGEVTLTDQEVGKTVIDMTGDEVGLITDVDDSGQMMYVDAHPSITERIKAALDWGGRGEDNYPINANQVRRITDDEVELKGAEELEETR